MPLPEVLLRVEWKVLMQSMAHCQQVVNAQTAMGLVEAPYVRGPRFLTRGGHTAFHCDHGGGLHPCEQERGLIIPVLSWCRLLPPSKVVSAGPSAPAHGAGACFPFPPPLSRKNANTALAVRSAWLQVGSGETKWGAVWRHRLSQRPWQGLRCRVASFPGTTSSQQKVFYRLPQSL